MKAFLRCFPWVCSVFFSALPARAFHVLSDVEAARKAAAMSVPHKVGQLMMVGVAGTVLNDDMRLWVAERKAGGVAFFARNLNDRVQIKKLTSEVFSLLSPQDTAPFMALDQEGGVVVRVKEGMSPLPSAMALGATQSPSLAYFAGMSTGGDLKTLGFNMNFAPVLDVNSNPANPVIGVRSLGSDPAQVALLGKWFVKGQQEMGVLSVVKHFPGHGDTQVDSHFATPLSRVNIQQLQRRELVPFEASILEGVDVVMTAHIAFPLITGEKSLPSSLSERVVQSLLRERLGFDGVILTDGIEMQAVAQSYGEGVAAVKAVLAGADMVMVLWSDKAKEEVYESLREAVEMGVVSKERLDASVARILRVKSKYGLLDTQTVLAQPPQTPPTPHPWHRALMQQVADASVTVLYDKTHAIPLSQKEVPTLLFASDTVLGKRLSLLPGVRQWVKFKRSFSFKQRMKALHTLGQYAHAVKRVVVVAENSLPLELVETLKKKHPSLEIVAVGMGSPYEAYKHSGIDSYVCAYSALDSAQTAVGKVLWGENPAKGVLPVSVLP